MAFSEEATKVMFNMAEGQCMCRIESHNHTGGRCSKKLVWENRGRTDIGGWEAGHINPTRGDSPSNCQILCWDCHALTP